MNVLKKYAGMPSTWRGVFALLGVAGISFLPDQQEAIAAFVVTGLGIIEVFRKEEKK